MKLRFKQQGSLLITSLFVAIVLLALGLALTRVLEGSAQSNAVEYYGSKAFLSAQSGIEWKLNDLFPLNGVGTCSNVVETPDFSGAPYMANCSVAVLCQSVEDIIDANTATGEVNVYRISSTSRCDAGQWTTERSINVEAKTLY